MRTIKIIIAGKRLVVVGVLYAVGFPAFATDVFGSGNEYPWDAPPSFVSLDPRYVLPKLSTLGVGMEYRYASSARFGLRMETFKYQQGREEVNDLLRTRLQLKLQWNSLLFDWFPFDGQFRATAGMYINRSEISGSANYDNVQHGGYTISAHKINSAAAAAAKKLTEMGYADYAAPLEKLAATNEESFTIGGRTIKLSELARATASVRFRPHAPFLGFGWASHDAKRSGAFYSIDVGILDLGKPHVRYSISGPVADAARTHYGSEYDAWMMREQQEAEEKLRKYRYYPVVSFGFGYRF